MFELLNFDSALGIEIRADRLAFATVSKGWNDYTLKNHAVLENYRDLPLPELHRWVQQHTRSEGFSRENVILGLPRERVVLRHLELPLEAEENLDQVVRFQVQKFEPGEEPQSYYDYLILERNEDRKKLLLQVIMVRKDYLDEQLNLFRELNLYPAAVRFSTVGIHQIFSAHADNHPQQEPYLAVEINPDGVEFILIASPEKFYSEKIRLSAEECTFDRILLELDRFLSRERIFEGRDVFAEGVARIYLSGSLADHFLENFGERFGEIELLAEKVNLKRWNRLYSAALNAAGIAISGTGKSSGGRYNLIPREKRLIAERPSLVPTLVLTGLLAVMGCAVGTRGYLQQHALLDQIEGQIQALQPQVDQIMTLRDQITERRARLEELASLMKGRQKVLLVFKELTERIPEDSYLQNLNIQGERVNLTGLSTSASRLLEVLLDSQYLATVESRYITPDRATNREKFAFEATIKKTESGIP